MKTESATRRGEEYELEVEKYVEFAIRIQDCDHRVIYQSPKHFMGESSALTFVANGGTSSDRLQ